MAWRVVATASLGPHEGVIARLVEAGCEIDRLPAAATTWTPELIARYASTADAYVGTFRGIGLPREVIEASPRARVITSPIIGTEYIDVKAATEAGVLVAHGAMSENFDGMAEAGVMLIAATRKALAGKTAAVRAGEWKTAPAGRLVLESTIGILGLGRIGQGVARRLNGWDCEIIACDPYVDPAAAAKLDVELVGIDDLFRRSDVVVILVTLTPETRHIVNADRIAAMKRGSAIVNIGRGGCMDEAAVIAALDSGQLAAVAIDAWESEPPAPDNALRSHPAVIATSHDVGHSTDLYARIPVVAAENTLAALEGRRPDYLHNPAALPAWRERWNDAPQPAAAGAL
ncbi:MAG: NAD(P)-dependent oxidoreductase [Brevundimonas sp.]|uniref:NAD(P)-dependent oxidoreductase n=1 Tax=Brevundimonas sp. TaxID=1871086 RepID=UPI0024878226|nr:NAD(P)-dependent oxidoreductase [Brevundimonas sp.]MDI1326223.1 NAD(P)-dependent oxidoreductase [Brevundimonas sp.]